MCRVVWLTWWFRTMPLRPLWLAVLVVVTLSGCGGYRWMASDGAISGSGAPQVLAVPPFINETDEPLLSERITASLRARLLAGGVTVSGNAETMLKGRLISFSDEVRAFDASVTASHRRVVLTAHVTVTRGSDILWDSPVTVGSAIYAVSGDPTRNRDNKDRAVAEAAVGLSEQILLALITLEPSP